MTAAESYQSSIRRNDTDCGGGRPTAPEATSARENQRTSSSSSSAFATAPGAARRREADHQRRRKRPGLRRVVPGIDGGDAGLLEHLAQDCVLEAFAWLDESRDGRIAARGPGSLPAQQGPLAVGHEHDDCGVEAREMLVAARDVAAPHDVACTCDRRRRAAGSAVAVTPSPENHRPRIGEEARLVGGKVPANHAQILERSRLGQRCWRRVAMDFDGETDHVAKAAQHHEVVVIHGEPKLVVYLDEPGRPAVGIPAHQAARAPHRHEQALRVPRGGRDEVRVLAQVRGAVEVGSGEYVRDWQGRWFRVEPAV